jgi:hypothetical protein
MLPIRSILDALGKSADDPALKCLLQAFGVKRKPELDEDDEEAVTDWLPVQKAGIEFGFMTKGALKGDIGPSKYAGPLILHKIIFYCSFEGMESYRGELPHGIVKMDSRREVVNKLTRYEPARRAYIRDVWELQEHRLIVTYTEGEKSVSSVICTLRPYPYSRMMPDVPPLPSMEQIIGAFGSPARSEPMSTLFGPFHIEKHKDEIFEEYEADFRLDYGFELYFCPGTDIGLKQKRLVFAGLKFYRDRDLDARGWPGELPFGLLFDDDPNTMLRKVSVKPVEHKDDNLDGDALWHFERFSLHVYYSNLENCLYRVMVLAPGYWQSLD